MLRVPDRLRRCARRWLPLGVLELARRALGSAVARPPDVAFSLPARSLGELFAGIEVHELRVPVAALDTRDHMVAPLDELLALAAVCRYIQPRRVFEIGTYTGVSTLLMAMNTPPEAEVLTLDIDPRDRAAHQTGLGVGAFPVFTVGAAYQGTASAGKIRQLLGSSTTFDYTPFWGSVDLVFVDADHTYKYVKADTAVALRLLRPGGVIIWDDYLWEPRFPECAGVTRCVNELAQTRRVARIAGTRLAIYVDR